MARDSAADMASGLLEKTQQIPETAMEKPDILPDTPLDKGKNKLGLCRKTKDVLLFVATLLDLLL